MSRSYNVARPASARPNRTSTGNTSSAGAASRSRRDVIAKTAPSRARPRTVALMSGALGFLAAEANEGTARRLLLGFLLRVPLALRDPPSLDPALHAEDAPVAGPFLRRQPVLWHALPASLQQLLQRALRVADFRL